MNLHEAAPKMYDLLKRLSTEFWKGDVEDAEAFAIEAKALIKQIDIEETALYYHVKWDTGNRTIERYYKALSSSQVKNFLIANPVCFGKKSFTITKVLRLPVGIGVDITGHKLKS